MYSNQFQGYSIIPFQILRSNSQQFILPKYNNIISPIKESKEKFSINMLATPDVKINVNNISPQIKGTKLFNQNMKSSLEDLKTSTSISNESLTSNSNSYNGFSLNNNLYKNNVKPFSLLPNLININNNINRSYSNNQNRYFLQRNVSMNNLLYKNTSNVNQFINNKNNICDNNNINKPLFSNSKDYFDDNKKSKNIKFYNKFNNKKENLNSENTTILTLKIKVSKNDYRFFYLKKYDDLFISLQKFFDLNQIKPHLIKPIVSKIFLTLNKIFWVLNSKIGIYDQEYLSSLYKLWLKNGKEININNNNENDLSSDDSNSPIKNKSFQNENSFDKSYHKTSKSL